MTERESDILTAIIEEYVQTATPVPSGLLAEEYDFGISPASIRGVMNHLEESEYLSSPHTSAGRVPTEKAYRWHVTRALDERAKPSPREQELFSRRLGDASGDQTVRTAASLLSDLIRLATLARYSGNTQLFGLSNLFRQPEYQIPERARDFAEVIDRADELSREIPDGAELHVYIGQEAPLGRSADYALLVRRFWTPWGEPVLFGVIGPTRMPYRRAISLLDYVTRLMEDRNGR